MSPVYGFLGALLVTVGMLVGAAITGRKRKIPMHIAFVTAAVSGLGVAIYFALKVGELYDLEKAGMITPIHLTLARVTTAAYLWPLVTGPLAMRGKIRPRIHHFGAYVALVLTLAATVTGVMMLYGAERLV
ncbi:hypothetical protein Poly30_11920 [Planctomycetes bacterium Poly30]|uniref:DUF420 domain-containing protein n=1 Tax=Saltatorellus ferox TaxID=2528018 RepID=A0A518ENM6_9BACT|nr:hypothetical protein Poly30_11920 [Planctomycetes bacterium Poly30]